MQIFIIDKETKDNSQTENVTTSDEPIIEDSEDELGRTDFINIFYDVLKTDYNKSKSIVLSGKWGEGKTSCINLLKLKSESNKDNYKFIDLNPWFNDTKEKLINAFFGELNSFTKSNKPYISIDSKLNDIIKLSDIELGYVKFSLDSFSKDKNIKYKIEEIGEILQKSDKRLVVCIDDIDRLQKDLILSIVQIVKMFMEYTNIIFILSMDLYKVEQILCESSESCLDKEEMFKKLSYSKYIEKISPVILELPKIDRYHIQDILFKKLNEIIYKIYKDKNKDKYQDINKTDFNIYIATKRFKNIRDVKRFCNTFYISYPQVNGEVDIFNYINITILFLFYRNLYDYAWNNQYQFFRKSVDIHNDNELQKANNFFNDLVNENAIDVEDKEAIYELLSLVSPVYRNLPAVENKIYSKQPSMSIKSYFYTNIYDIEFKNRYLDVYFTHAVSDNRISDRILDSTLAEWKNEKDDNKRQQLMFIFFNDYQTKLNDMFIYLEQQEDKYSKLHKNIIINFSKISKQLTKIKSFKDISMSIQRLSVFKSIKKLDFCKTLIEDDKSDIRFAFDIYNAFYGALKPDISDDIIRNINNIINNKISTNIEDFINIVSSYEYRCILYSWIQNRYVRDSKDFDILKLEPKQYYDLKQRVDNVAKYVLDNIEYFKIFIAYYLLENVDLYNKQIPIYNFDYYLLIWGTDNIKNALNRFKNDDAGINKLYDFINSMDDNMKSELSKKEKILLEKLKQLNS